MAQSTDVKKVWNRYLHEFREHPMAFRLSVAKAAKELNLY